MMLIKRLPPCHRAVVLRAIALALSAGCATQQPGTDRERSTAFELPPPAITADSSRAEHIAPGVVHRYYWMSHGPWAIHVLDVDRDACWTFAAAKHGEGAVGRARTSTIVGQARESGREIAGGVNGDFFLFAPPGVPVGAHVEDGRLVAGPVGRPVVLVDSSGAVHVDSLRVAGWLAAPSFGAEILAWNRPRTDALAFFDAQWGAATDTSTGSLEVVLGGRPRGVVLAIDTLATGVDIPRDGAVLVAGRGAPAVLHRQLLTLRVHEDTLSVAVGLVPVQPREAIGGFPVLLRDGVEVAGLGAAGGVQFGPVRHPRTAVGIGHAGRRLLLVVVDGRQPPYSDGMTLRELAHLMRSLGAEEALNLDGGGSTTMAVAGTGAQAGVPDRVVNRPSDRDGERAVGNALLVERGCRDAPPSAP